MVRNKIQFPVKVTVMGKIFCLFLFNQLET